ncbi:hypothetical protein CS542_08365 [Pedobacter sp. IW39]|nr:hypothetical protein CS542_08365 [Pedobacter sp. IW39]
MHNARTCYICFILKKEEIALYYLRDFAGVDPKMEMHYGTDELNTANNQVEKKTTNDYSKATV